MHTVILLWVSVLLYILVHFHIYILKTSVQFNSIVCMHTKDTSNKQLILSYIKVMPYTNLSSSLLTSTSESSASTLRATMWSSISLFVPVKIKDLSN